MENERIERETHYKYDENEKLVSMTVHETITNPCYNCEDCDDGELMTGEIEFTEDKPTLSDVAMALASIGLCLTAVATIIKHR